MQTCLFVIVVLIVIIIINQFTYTTALKHSFQVNIMARQSCTVYNKYFWRLLRQYFKDFITQL